jgi:ABC-type Mn2+/Zn2+ transport system permease subunit
VTSSVRIAGVFLVFVFLVFAFLVIPAVAGVLASERTGVRLAVGWTFGFLFSIVGLLAAFGLNTPAAPTILVVLTLALMVHGALTPLIRRILRATG